MFKDINDLYHNFDKITRYTEDCRVLIVEDDKELNKNLTEIFTPFFNIEIHNAFNGEEGINKYKKAIEDNLRYDIVISDIKMPYKNGIQLAKEIKDIHKEQYIIIITAFDDTDELIKLIDLNINKFILKPDIFDILLIEVMKIAKNIYEEKMLHLFIQKREEACKYSTCSLESNDKFNIMIYTQSLRTADIYKDYLTSLCGIFQIENDFKQAYSYLIKNKVSVILIDVEEENLDGYKLAKLVSTNSTICKTPMIFLSTKDIKFDLIQLGYKLGAVDWIIKDINYFYTLFNRVQIYQELFLRKQELVTINNNLENIIEEQTKELKNINSTLKEKINKEVEQSRTKDIIMFQQSKSASMGEMISNIAHQWRQPISAVNAIIQGIQLKNRLNKLDTEYIETQASNASEIIQKMSATINDFRDFFKPNKKIETFSLTNIIEKDLSFLNIIYEKNNINLIKLIPIDLTIEGYKGEFSQVVMNILSNAKDILVAQDIKEKVVIIDAKIINNKIIISIQDNGGGITDNIKDKIFEPYFTTKHQSQGTGIGLYMSRQIIQTHMNGTLNSKNDSFEYNNKKYYGAKFVIILENKKKEKENKEC
jgi:signal transduction histidine kinase/ActR/RegA family two-component response regulator